MEIDIDKLKEKTKDIAEKHNLRLVILYGSYAKGFVKQDSDIDIAFLGKKKFSFNEEISVNMDFMDICGEFGIKEVDTKSLHNTNPLFRHQVMKDGVLIYGSSYDFNSFRAYAFRSYCDSGDLLKLKDIIINKRMANLKAI